MLLLLAVVVLSLVYVFRIPRLRRLTADQFPGIDPQIITQWRTLELRSVYVLLLTTVGLLALTGGIVLLALQQQVTMQDKQTQTLFALGDRLIMLLAFVGLIVAGNYGAQAGKLRKLHSLSFPKKR